MDNKTIGIYSVACTKVEDTIKAIRETVKLFPCRATLITHEDLNLPDIEVIKTKKLDYKEYNDFVAMKLHEYVDTDFCLLVQNDGYVLNPEMWTDEFFDYDYIGALWPPETHYTKDGKEVRVGNGGFSFRSKKLLEAPVKMGLTFTDMETGFWHEDGFLCVHHRDELERFGIKFAPVKLAARFSTELTVPETTKSFGFHRYKP